MDIIAEIKELRERVQKHLGDKDKMVIISKEKDLDIRGGLDIRTDGKEISITKDGWDIRNYEEETNSYKYRGSETTKSDHFKASDEHIEKYINGNDCTLNEFEQFLHAYNDQ